MEGVTDITFGILEIFQPVLYAGILDSRQTGFFSEVFGIIGIRQTAVLTAKDFRNFKEKLCFDLAGAEKIAGDIFFVLLHRGLCGQIMIDLSFTEENRVHDFIGMTMKGVLTNGNGFILTHTDIVEFLHEMFRPHSVLFGAFITGTEGTGHRNFFLVVIDEIKEEELTGFTAADLIMPDNIRTDNKGIAVFVENLIIHRTVIALGNVIVAVAIDEFVGNGIFFGIAGPPEHFRLIDHNGTVAHALHNVIKGVIGEDRTIIQTEPKTYDADIMMGILCMEDHFIVLRNGRIAHTYNSLSLIFEGFSDIEILFPEGDIGQLIPSVVIALDGLAVFPTGFELNFPQFI